MRETRTSGSVEGVLSNGHPYSDSCSVRGRRGRGQSVVTGDGIAS